jgi:hypothetical protein
MRHNEWKRQETNGKSNLYIRKMEAMEVGTVMQKHV